MAKWPWQRVWSSISFSRSIMARSWTRAEAITAACGIQPPQAFLTDILQISSRMWTQTKIHLNYRKASHAVVSGWPPRLWTSTNLCPRRKVYFPFQVTLCKSYRQPIRTKLPSCNSWALSAELSFLSTHSDVPWQLIHFWCWCQWCRQQQPNGCLLILQVLDQRWSI